MIRSKMLAEEARSAYSSGKEFAYDHVHLEKTIPFPKKVNESHPPFVHGAILGLRARF